MRPSFAISSVVVALTAVAGCGNEETWSTTYTMDGEALVTDQGGCTSGGGDPDISSDTEDPWLTCWVRSGQWDLELSVWDVDGPGSYTAATPLPYDCEYDQATNVMLRHWYYATLQDEQDDVKSFDELYGSCATAFPATIEIIELDEGASVVEGSLSATPLRQIPLPGSCDCTAGGGSARASLEFRLPLGRMTDF